MTSFTGPRASRVAVLLTCLLLALGVVAVLGPAEPAHAAAPALRVSNRAVIPGEATRITGKLARGVRPVVLQVKVGRKWRKVSARRTTRSGAFAFVVKPRRTSVYRAYAPRAKVARKKRRAVASRTVRIATVGQYASAYTLPGIAAYGSSPQSSASAQSVVTSRFAPARPGRTVVMQVLSNGRWVKVASARQNTYGSAAFKVNAIPAGSVRVVALGFRGAPAFAGNVAKRSWKTDYVTEFSGSSLPSDWSYRLENQYPGGLRNCARSARDMIEVAGGAVRISSAKDPFARKSAKECPRGTFRNGHIGTTYDTYTAGYGIAAARVKFQEGGGQHSAFWLQSQSGNVGSEIDVAEYFGKGRSDYGLTQFIHYKTPQGKDQTSGSITDRAYQVRTRQALGASGDDWWKAYHVFSVEWSANAYIFRIDGVETFRTNKGLTNRKAVLILSSLTSDYEIPRFGGTLAQNTTTVDWVKTWTP